MPVCCNLSSTGVKADDSLRLNEIYSRTKKYWQSQSTTEEKETAKNLLEKVIENSELPDTLKTTRNYGNDAVFDRGGFLYLVCHYYKIRQKARDGRVFIHPEFRYTKDRGYENTGRFDDKEHLLTYCNHKPRQKRYQMLGDLAGLLQVAPKQLEESVQQQNESAIDEKLFNWLKNIPNLKTRCDQAAKEQKERRGRLKLDIQYIYGLIYHRRQSKSPSVKEILKKSKVNEASKLHSFCERAKESCLRVTQSLYDASKQQQWQQVLDNNPATAVYLLAQINNLAFKQRNGNANTCAVCCMDNAQRIQTVVSVNGKDSHAKAQRLPAIETRLINGAVMRMARIVCGAIADDKWQKIKMELEKGKQVHIPIITESNRFEFEPSLEELVKAQRNKPRKGKVLERGSEDKIFQSKDDRIKRAGQFICPYTGGKIEENDNEVDHIIPRSSEQGTLNDEANLIYASNQGNQSKGAQIYRLSHLSGNYKRALFEKTDDVEITNWIVEQIGDEEGETFTFGQFRSFINLTPDQQKAFRHALFLVGHPLRQKVINAIDNRTRTLVNGTQRYFAEILANSLYKKAKAIGRRHLLSFDYFGVETQDSPRGYGIYKLRRKLVKYHRPDLKKYDKIAGNSQDPYSHLIDAQLAFCIVADAHRKEGSLKLSVINSGFATLFNAIQVKPEQIRKETLKRRKPEKTFFEHRSIHRDGIYAERYMLILVHKKTGEVHIGFDWNNSYKLNENETNREKLYFALQFNLQGVYLNLTKNDPFKKLIESLSMNGFNSKTEYFYVPLNAQDIHTHYIKNYNTAKGYQKYDDRMVFLRSLSYRTEKKKITNLEDAEKTLSKEANFQTPTKKTNSAP